MIEERANKLRGFIAEIELNLERKGQIQAAITEIYGVAKAQGFDTRAMRATIKARSWDKGELAAFERLCDEYRDAVGDFASTPLGQFFDPVKGKTSRQ